MFSTLLILLLKAVPLSKLTLILTTGEFRSLRERSRRSGQALPCCPRRALRRVTVPNVPVARSGDTPSLQPGSRCLGLLRDGTGRAVLTPVRVLGRVQIRGRGGLDGQLRDGDLVWHERVAPAEADPVLTVRSDLSGRREAAVEAVRRRTGGRAPRPGDARRGMGDGEPWHRAAFH